MNSSSPGENYVLKAEGITKTFKLGKREIPVLKGVNLEIQPGEFVAIVGPSGAGKSTLLHILGSLEQPTSGNITVDGRNMSSLSDDDLAQFRRKQVGFVFQFHHLLPAFSALENVMMPALIRGESDTVAKKNAGELLLSMGLGERFENKPAELSGGEQQRVAVARAMVNSPGLMLADEPTGNLDRATGSILEQDLIKIAKERNTAILIVTHNEEWAAKADRVLTLVDGQFK
jgi:lipoprotein-releasing system ATP-binding protein